MEFDVKSQKLLCPNCGTEGEIISDGVIEEFVFSPEEILKASQPWPDSVTIEKCSGCGAEITVPEHATTVECAYCGTDMILEKKQHSGIIPEAIVPFKIDKQTALDSFRKWMRKRWLAPRAAKNLLQLDKMQAVYTPYWTYDALTRSPYTAQGGEVYYVTVRDGDKTRTEQRVRWYPTSGVIDYFFDDVRVCASNRNAQMNEEVDEYQKDDLLPFSTGYISGFSTEKYSFGPDEGFQIAQHKMRDEITALVSADVLKRFDRVMGISFSTNYSNVTFKHILLPIYSSGYKYRDKIYSFVVSGLTGKVTGNFPYSKLKIALLIAAAVILAVACFAIYNSQ